jgi:aryl-alcohol dehydrogenase-like predicted oxidoreductase
MTKINKPAPRAVSNRQATSPSGGPIPSRLFGSHSDVRISALGMGGHHLGDAKDEQTAVSLVKEAVEGGITFFDNCWEYHRGKSEVWTGKGLKGLREKVFLMTKVCTHGRDASLALQMLEESLKRLQTDHLDLWQIPGSSRPPRSTMATSDASSTTILRRRSFRLNPISQIRK